MTTERLSELRNAKPFRPFTIYMADGRSIRVDHPDFLASSPAGRTIVVFGRDDSMLIIDLLTVTAMEVGQVQRRRRSA